MTTPVVKSANPMIEKKKIMSRESNTPFWNPSKCGMTLNEDTKSTRAAGAQRITNCLRHLPGDSKRTHRRSLIEVGHQHRVFSRRDDDVAVCDRLDVHERHDGVVLVDEGGRRIAS